jgi:hypothetical protein
MNDWKLEPRHRGGYAERSFCAGTECGTIVGGRSSITTPKAAEGRTHSKTLRVRGAAAIRASVLNCAQPSGALLRRSDLRPIIRSITLWLVAG